MRKKNIKKANKLMVAGILAPMIFVLMLIYTDIKLRPVVLTMSQYRTQSLVMEAVNTAIIKQVSQTDIKYDDLVSINKNDNGEILSIAYNTLQVNKLKSEITHAVIEETEKIPDTDLYIPLGTITGIDMIQNKGPLLKFTINPSSYVQSDIESVFQNTGINQVNHRIFIILKVTANSLIPNYSSSVVIENKVCVAETIIIGKVPNNIGNGLISYTN